MTAFLKNFVSRNTEVRAYVGNAEPTFVVDVSVFGVLVSRTKIHPPMGTYGNICGMPSCRGIHSSPNLLYGS